MAIATDRTLDQFLRLPETKPAPLQANLHDAAEHGQQILFRRQLPPTGDS